MPSHKILKLCELISFVEEHGLNDFIDIKKITDFLSNELNKKND